MNEHNKKYEIDSGSKIKLNNSKGNIAISVILAVKIKRTPNR